MIADVRMHPRDPGLATAVGPLYDTERIVTVAAAFVRAIAGPAMQLFPAGRPRLRLGYDGRIEPFEADAGSRLRFAFRERRRLYEFDDYEARFDLGRLRIRARLMGYEALYATENGIRLLDGQEPERLDPTPTLMVHRRSGVHMTEEQRRLVTKLCEIATAQGVIADRAADGLVKPICIVTFPHAIFGLGQGQVRIRLVRQLEDFP